MFGAIVSLLSLIVSCDEDDDLNGPSKDGVVLVSSSGFNTEFDTFEFTVIAFSDSIIISAVESNDTLSIFLFDYSSLEVDSAISLSDTNLLVIGTFGSGKHSVTNFGSLLEIFLNVSGSITFTSLDNTGSIAATFSSDATLIADDNTTGMAMIAGDFVAMKAAGATVAASIVRRKIINRPQ